MVFVYAAAVLRSHNFGISTLNLFETKKIAGNIVPAIAGTNSIAAAL
jgi:ubiquitin-like 1-activating enzyme E1 B